MTRAWLAIECSWWLRSLVGALAGVVVGAVVVWTVQNIAVDTRAPTVIGRVEALNSPVAVGGKLVVRVTREKARGDCPVTSARYVSDENGIARDIPDAVWAGGPLGTKFVDLVYDTSALPPGLYTLHVSLLFSCPGMSFPVRQPSVNFHVAQG